MSERKLSKWKFFVCSCIFKLLLFDLFGRLNKSKIKNKDEIAGQYWHTVFKFETMTPYGD
jgi:hypothetical protein